MTDATMASFLPRREASDMRHVIGHASDADVDAVASLWHAGWHDAHAALVPAALVDQRRLESFGTRTRRHLSRIRVARSDDSIVVGLCITREDELHQLYVAPAARGAGVALGLMRDAERQLRGRGVTRAWLACAIGNERAAGFYRKCGWRLAGTEDDELETVDGTFSLTVWRFEKRLS